MGNFDLVRDCMIRVSYIGLSWASAAFQIELVRLGEEEVCLQVFMSTIASQLKWMLLHCGS